MQSEECRGCVELEKLAVDSAEPQSLLSQFLYSLDRASMILLETGEWANPQSDAKAAKMSSASA